MENKKDLAKIALAALILASATPVNGQADGIEAHGTFLAAGCPAHGCPAASGNTDKVISSNNPSSNPRASNPSNNGYNDQPYREYNTTTDSDYNRPAATTSHSSATLTEAQLIGMLNPQGEAIYLSLDAQGKALAIQLASQDSYRDKNLAVKEAQRRMNERRR